MKKIIQNLKVLLLIGVSFLTFTLYFLNNIRDSRMTLVDETKDNNFDIELKDLVPSILNISNLVHQHLQISKDNHLQKLISLLSIPSIQNFLPHLIRDPSSLEPSFKISKKTIPSQIVVGIGTVRRNGANYLEDTLSSIFENANTEEISQILVIVMIAETNNQTVKNISIEIEKKFKEQIQSGALEIISPPANFYPSLDTLQPNLGDKKERYKWRAKQVLDYIFLMMYAQQRSSAYYLQLEDDILVKDKNFITTIQDAAKKFTTHNPNWFLMNFAEQGFIGKFFKATDLPIMVMYFAMFYKNNPVDLLLYDIVYAKACTSGISAKDCAKEKLKIEYHHSPSLFHHIGAKSSLPGKTNKIEQ